MSRFYRFQIKPPVTHAVVRLLLRRASQAIEAICGEAEAERHAAFGRDAGEVVLTIDASTSAGLALMKVLTRFLIADYSSSAFRLRRVQQRQVTGASKEAA